MIKWPFREILNYVSSHMHLLSTTRNAAGEYVCPPLHFNFVHRPAVRKLSSGPGNATHGSWPEVRTKILHDNRGLVGFQLVRCFDPLPKPVPIGLADSPLVPN